jgi:hypothetical protein
MNPPTLLLEIEMRGASIRCAGERLKVANDQALTPSLRAKIRENKPAIISILAHGDSYADAPRFRRVNEFVWAPLNPKPAAPGAVKITARFQLFAKLIDAARRRELPKKPLTIRTPGGDVWEVENAAAAVLELDKAWGYRASQCQREMRDLTTPEADALDAATELLKMVWACYDGPGAAWLDLTEILQALDADYLAMLKFQHHNRAPGAKETHR